MRDLITRQPMTTSERLRVGVVGCGSIAQIAHLPNLALLPSLFELVGVADPSGVVARATAARWATRSFTDHRQLLADAEPDALLVAAPHGAHAEIGHDALAAGVHLLVEKPLCVSSADAEEIARRAAAGGLVVQVGYMKRYDEAYEALLADLERDRPQLLYVGALTSEGRELPRTFNSTPVPRADDVAPALLARWQESERRQMSQAIGTTDPRAVGVFSGLFLADLVHDVNLILGILGVADASPAADPGSRHWNDGRAGVLDFSTPAGVGCTIAYAEIPGASEYDEQISVVTDAGVYRLRFPPPYLLRAPTLYERRVQVRSRVHTSTVRSYSEPFVAELAAFHASVTHGVACRTPAAQAAEDLELLERAFRAGG